MTERPLLVLLHGWGSTRAVWKPVVERLQNHYECYLPELPGHGDSGFTETRLEPLARQIAGSVDRPAIWLGWSLGALITIQAALQAPQQVKQLLIVSGTPAFVQQESWDSAMPVDIFDQFSEGYRADAAKTLKRFVTLQGQGDQQAKMVMQQLSKAMTKNTQALGWGLAVLRDGDLLSELSAIACPVNCLYGEKDALVPATIQHSMQDLGITQVTVWPDTGHVPFLSQPDKFVNWIESVVVHG